MKQSGSNKRAVSSIDWTAIHRRLEASAGGMERESAPAPEARKKILKERAAILARERRTDQTAEARLEVIEFILAYEHYAIEASRVREVYPLKEITPLPGPPLFVLGIINVRGQIVSVVDLKRFFGLPDKGLTDLNKVIILSDGNIEFGLLADAVPGLRQVSGGDIQPPPPTLTGRQADYVRGITTDRLVMLDAAKILADPALRICQSTDT